MTNDTSVGARQRHVATAAALVILPTYNEAENIQGLVEQILASSAQSTPNPFHVLVVDDNSPDGTGELADSIAASDPRVSVIHRPRKLGLGTAYMAGFDHALAHGYPCAVTMDADLSHNPRYLPGLMALMSAHDVAIGSRYVPGGGTTGWPLTRKVLSRGANTFAKLVLGLETHDCTAGFRCYKRQVLQEIELETILSEGYSFLVEMVTRCERRGYSVGELPIVFENRRQGQSKISRVEVWRSIYTILRLRLPSLPWGRSPERRGSATARLRQASRRAPAPPEGQHPETVESGEAR